MSALDRVQTDIKKLKQKYNIQLTSLKELFSDWTEEDLLFTLQDTDGDLDLAIDRISEGHANQWDEVKTKKSRKPVTEVSSSTTTTTAAATTTATTVTATATSITAATATTTSTTATPHSKYNNKTKQRPTTISSHRYQQKPQTTSWQSNSWNSNGWNDSTPKKPSSTPSKSNKTWASLLQSKETPVVEKDLPPLKKVDESWLTPATNNTVNKGDDISVDFSSLSLVDEKNVPENKSMNVADLFNSVKHEPLTNTSFQQDYSAFNNVSMYGGSDQLFQQPFEYQRSNYYDQKFTAPKQNMLYNDFYPQYYQQPFNSYSPYNNSSSRNVYPQQLPATTTSSSSTTSASLQSPYMYSSQNLYNFNDFGLSSTQYREEEPRNPSPQQYPTMFSYGRSHGNMQQPYWNQ